MAGLPHACNDKLIAMHVTSSRRRFLIHSAGLLGAARLHAQTGLTAQQVVERIQKNIGVAWRAQTVDTFKAGNPDTPVKGIATSVMATFDVLQRAAAAGRNFVISHEPTFYSHEDQTDSLSADPVFLAKQSLIQKNSMVVFRFHDHWHMYRPEPMLTGFLNGLGWEKYRTEGQRFLTIPKMSLEALTKHLQTRLKIGSMRVIGDPRLEVTKVAYSPGYAGGINAARGLNREVDVVITGEAREWEGIEYAQDLVAEGNRKAMIVLGHAVSEELGMAVCAKWLKTFITEVPIEHISAGEPFWTPK